MKHSASALIAAAKRDAPRNSLEGDILGAIGAGTAVALAPSFGAKLWLALKHAAVSKAGIATIAFTAATGGYAAGRLQERAIHESAIATQAQTQTQTQTPTRTQTLTQTPTQTQTPTRTETRTSTIAITVATTSPASTVTEPKSVATTTPTTPPPPPPSASLADEVAAIKRARGAILAKNAEGALAALADYDREHPNGVMSEESLALRVRANRLAGDEVGAADALANLEQRFPASVQLAALRR